MFIAKYIEGWWCGEQFFGACHKKKKYQKFQDKDVPDEDVKYFIDAA